MLSEWVVKALQHAGIGQAELARRMSDFLGMPVDRSIVNKIIKNRRAVSPEELVAIATCTGVPVPTEYSASTKPTVELVGYVGAGAEAHLFSEGQGPFDQVDAPDDASENTVAVEVRGDSLGHSFNGWLIFYDQIHDPPTAELMGELCVVGLQDGRVLVKTIDVGGISGAYTLYSNVGPPIYDAFVKWAAKVTNMRPRR